MSCDVNNGKEPFIDIVEIQVIRLKKLMEQFTELLKLASVGIISGVFSSLVAYRAHRQKKWWELRVAAYQELIYALSDLTHYYSVHHDAEINRSNFSDSFKTKIEAEWNESYPKVRRAADSGAFLFSPEVNSALHSFRDTNDTQQDCYFEHLDTNFAAANGCLKTVVECSKTDLETRWWWE